MRKFQTLILLIGLATGMPATAADGFELPPIEYSSTTPANPISQLQSRIDSGKASVTKDGQPGYLRAVLNELDVPIDSQVLVFSQTSLQRHLISPETPRAIYFNDDVYIGYCQNGEVLEVSAADPRLGTVFYTLSQHDAGRPQFARQTDHCLQCHHSSRTEGVPGHVVRSLFVGKNGLPIFSGGSYNVDHTTPLDHRWGGWYVTGTHGAQEHLGNLVIPTADVPAVVDNSAGQNQAAIPDTVTRSAYLSPHSDIVAHMVLEHQVLVHNRMTKANFAARQALASDAEMRKILGEKDNQLLESTVRRIASAGEDLVEALLFAEEAPLKGPVAGTSGFEQSFPRRGPHDSQGRSLRDFDLKTRMFKYPCSYLIGSESFRKLPPEMLDFVWNRLKAVLVDGTEPKKYAHLSPEARQAIVEILLETHPDAAARWKTLPGVSTE
ncbi:MAG TPA: hypothetical protein VM510_03060 [Caulifigura sp.]|jgi:hypothetical protein|nr:hypothetical protein [Caulifigura sp.]